MGADAHLDSLKIIQTPQSAGWSPSTALLSTVLSWETSPILQFVVTGPGWIHLIRGGPDESCQNKYNKSSHILLVLGCYVVKCNAKRPRECCNMMRQGQMFTNHDTQVFCSLLLGRQLKIIEIKKKKKISLKEWLEGTLIFLPSQCTISRQSSFALLQ